MLEWVNLATAGVKFAKELGLWDKVRFALTKRKKVLVLGASGSGKTQFVHSLHQPLANPLQMYQRTVTAHKRQLVVEDHPFVLIDTPGQRFDVAKRKRAITEAIQTRVEGIINVTCYGYHVADEADSTDAVAERGPAIAKAGYLRERRAVELDLLSEWVPHVDETVTSWVLTVVTKADLWWPDDGREIRDYYEQGTYAEVLGPLRTYHSVVPYCSVIEPFYGSRTSGRFGDQYRLGLHANLIETLARLAEVT